MAMTPRLIKGGHRRNGKSPCPEPCMAPYQSKLYHELVDVNSKLWEVEDELRVIESTKNFDSIFIELARKVYYTNDERFSLKNKINELTNSEVREQKDYIEYK